MLVQDAARIEAEKLAKEMKVSEYPVDVTAIAEKLDIEVTPVTFIDDRTSGMIIADAEKQTVEILIADSEDFERQRFTIAHELGHYKERKIANDDDYSFVEKRHPDSYDLHEFYADEFAGNLLMPARVICDLYEADKSVSAMATFFGVTPSAVRKRLTRLKKMGRI